MSDLTDELLRLLGEGRTIEAVRRYREATGVGLAEAKSAIDQLVAGLQSSPDAASESDDELTTEVLELARTSGLIAAIKRYREATGSGLKDAKEAVEALCRTHGVSPAAGTGAGPAVALIAALILAAVGIALAIVINAK